MVKSRAEVVKSVQFKMASCCGTCEHHDNWGFDDTVICKKLTELVDDGNYVRMPVYGKCRHHKKLKGIDDSLTYPF
jgi:hypothetical protein